MRRRKTRTVVTATGIILGVAVILGISITNLSTIEAFKETIDAITGRADFWINAPSDAGFKESYLKKVRSVKGVAVANPGIARGSRLVKKGRAEISLEVVGIDPSVDRELRRYQIKEGRFLSNKDRRAVLLVENFARENRVKLEERIVLASDRGFGRFKIVGLVSNQGVGRFVGGNVAFIPLKTAQTEFNYKGRLSYVDAKATSGSDLKAVEKRLRKVLGESFVVERPEKRVEAITQSLRSLQIGLSFFSAVALFVGGFLIFNTMSIVVVERTRELGMLRSLGATRNQISFLILAEAAIIGLFGSAFGLLLGMGLARGLLYFMSRTISSEIAVFKVPLYGLAASVFIGIAVSIVASLQPALTAGRISPLQSIRVMGQRMSVAYRSYLSILALFVMAIGIATSYRPQLIGAAPGSLVSRAGAFLLLLGAALLTPVTVGPAARLLRLPATVVAGSPGRLAADNLGRVRGRTAATISAIMISLAMLIGVGGMTDSFKDSVNRWVDRSIGADVFVAGQPNNLSIEKSFANRLQKIPGVKIITPIRFLRVRSGNEWITWRAIEPQTFKKLSSLQFVKGSRDEAWRQLEQNGSVFISTVLANRLNLKTGDKLTIKTNLGNRGFKIAGVIVDFGGETGDVAVGTRYDMKRYFGLDDVNIFRIKTEPGANSKDVAKEIKKRFKNEMSLDIQEIQEFRDMVNDQVSVSFAAFNIIVIIAVVVAAVGIINTLMMNILERRREIGILRALGSTRWQIRQMIVAEATITGALGFSFGLILGIYLSVNIIQAMQALTGYDVNYIFPWRVIWVSASIALIFPAVVSLLPAQIAAKTKIVEAVQYE